MLHAYTNSLGIGCCILKFINKLNPWERIYQSLMTHRECAESLVYSVKIPLCMSVWAGWMNGEKQHRLEREREGERKGNHLDLTQSKYESQWKIWNKWRPVRMQSAKTSWSGFITIRRLQRKSTQRTMKGAREANAASWGLFLSFYYYSHWRYFYFFCRSSGLGLNEMKRIGEALYIIGKRGPEVCLTIDNRLSV